MTTSSLPPGFTVALDPATRHVEGADGGAVLVGGSPLRLLRLTPAGGRLVDRLAAGAPVPPDGGAERLVRRLLDVGLVNPRPTAAVTAAAEPTTVVVPVRDDEGPLERLLAGPRAFDGADAVVLVDDGSREPLRPSPPPSWPPGLPLRTVRQPSALGPAAARNRGAAESDGPFIAFVDADCRPEPGWLAALLPHFADPAVAAVAPRVRPAAPPTPAGVHADGPGGGRWRRAALAYEGVRSPLDLGPLEAAVRPRGRVPYVPTAALVVRRAAFDAIGGFDADLTVGEDVDLVWRLVEAGHTVRYDPRVVVHHDVRTGPGAWLRQRYRYGTSAAPLARRHPGALAPVSVSGWSAAAWGLAVAGWPTAGAGAVAGVAVAAATTAGLVPRLGTLRHPALEALRLAGRGHVAAGRQLADALRRVGWPVALVASLGSQRARRVAALAAVAPPALEWIAGGRDGARRRVGPLAWLLWRAADDVAYGAGVWVGCARERTAAPLRPDFRNWPGRGRAVDPA